LHSQQISHGDLRSTEITVVDGTPLFGGFTHAEFGASDAQLHTDVAQLLITTTDLYGAPKAVAAAITVFGHESVLAASRRLTKAAV
ncbi:TIGR00374 family protein, partial [Mycobacterium sp. ITM-2017-0098]